MRVPVRRRIPLSFNMTPMIDVVFQLIIFFLVASHFSRQELAVEVDLPEAAKPEQIVEDETPRLTLTIPVEGEMYVGARRIEPENLDRIFRGEKARNEKSGFELRIRSGRGVTYRVIEPILQQAARAGISNIQFAVIQGAAP